MHLRHRKHLRPFEIPTPDKDTPVEAPIFWPVTFLVAFGVALAAPRTGWCVIVDVPVTSPLALAKPASSAPSRWWRKAGHMSKLAFLRNRGNWKTQAHTGRIVVDYAANSNNLRVPDQLGALGRQRIHVHVTGDWTQARRTCATRATDVSFERKHCSRRRRRTQVEIKTPATRRQSHINAGTVPESTNVARTQWPRSTYMAGFFFFVIRHAFTIEDLVSAPNLKLGCAVILRGCASDYKYIHWTVLVV